MGALGSTDEISQCASRHINGEHTLLLALNAGTLGLTCGLFLRHNECDLWSKVLLEGSKPREIVNVKSGLGAFAGIEWKLK